MDSTLGANIGLFAIWTQGDWVTKAVAVMLLVMSVTSWIVIFIKALDIVKYKGLSQKTEAFWHSESFKAGLDELGPQEGNPFVQLALAGQEATAHHRNAQTQLHDTLDISDWVIRTLRNSIDD